MLQFPVMFHNMQSKTPKKQRISSGVGEHFGCQNWKKWPVNVVAQILIAAMASCRSFGVSSFSVIYGALSGAPNYQSMLTMQIEMDTFLLLLTAHNLINKAAPMTCPGALHRL